VPLTLTGVDGTLYLRNVQIKRQIVRVESA